MIAKLNFKAICKEGELEQLKSTFYIKISKPGDSYEGNMMIFHKNYVKKEWYRSIKIVKFFN